MDMRSIGPYSRNKTLARLDGRRSEAKFMKETVEELTAHLGGKVSVVQRRLIERAAVLALRLQLMDAKNPDGEMTEKNAREYMCWNNAYVRLLTALGVQPAKARPLTGEEALAAIHADAARRRELAGQ